MTGIEIGTAVPGADGTPLHTDVFRPADGPAPAVVVRTPHGTRSAWAEAAAVCEAGFAVVLQDLRGRYGSGGEFAAGSDETADGLALLDRVAAADWCDGRVLLYGIGYEAYAAWCAAGHPAVAGIAGRQPWPAGPGPLPDELWWRTCYGGGRTDRAGLYELALAELPDGVDERSAGLAAHWPVPLGSWPPAATDWAGAVARTDRAVAETAVPSLHLGSWLCRSAPVTLRQARAAAGPARVVVGAWASELTHRLQDECALRVPAEPHPLELFVRWAAELLAGEDPLLPATVLLGADRWSAADPVPPVPSSYREASIPDDGWVTLPASPAYPALPHSADLAPLAGVPGVHRIGLGTPVWHGEAAVVAPVRADGPAALVATLLHERPDGVRTVLADGTNPVPPGAGEVVVRTAPVAVETPAGHRVVLELTTSRYPRHPGSAHDVAVRTGGVLVRLPQPDGGSFR
jgi:uncharacterized protein